MPNSNDPYLRTAGSVGLIWLCGICLRLTVLAVPPLLPTLRTELNLSGTEIGLLGSLPIALFAAAALPGSLLIARLGVLATVGGGLALVAIGSAGRGLGSTAALFVMTIVMGAGIAITQPAMPVLIRRWLPERVSFATAVYTNGLLVGTLPPVWLTLPLLMPLVGRSWQLCFVAWSLPVGLTALLVLALMARNGAQSAGPATQQSWWPEWRQSLYWQLGLLFGAINSLYFGVNTFIPGHLAGIGHPELVGGTLTAFNLGALPGSILLLGLARPLERRALPYVVLGLVLCGSLIGLVSAESVWLYAWAGLLGFGQGVSLMLGLALPTLISKPEDVARMSAAMFTISYALAGLIGIMGGVTWDLSGSATSAFVPIGLSGPIMIASAVLLRRAGVLR